MSNKIRKPKTKKPKCPDMFDVVFGRNLVRWLGGDASLVASGWCWKNFSRAFPQLRTKAEKYFAAANTGNPAWAAYRMVRDCDSDRAWAEKVKGSERGKTCSGGG